jgi:hypothetical protein
MNAMPNPPVNTDARASAALCKGRRARAGYWERYAAQVTSPSATRR